MEFIDEITILEEYTKINIDKFLDEYNDYMFLYCMFKDEDYLIKAQQLIQQLKKLYSLKELVLTIDTISFI